MCIYDLKTLKTPKKYVSNKLIFMKKFSKISKVISG